MAKMGRPKIEIDWSEFNKLCDIQCTLIEIAGWFDCSEDTIERRVQEKFGITFAEYHKKKSAKGKISLRRKQIQAALAGNVPLLIWTGKQYLGQKEPREPVQADFTKDGDKLVINFGKEAEPSQSSKKTEEKEET